jgi:acetylornithine/succinyldiaminopimelate/putrescine aminotransferase
MLKGTPLSGASSSSSSSGVTLSEAKGPTPRVQALLPVYAPMPVRPVRGHGSWLVDEDGHEWLDAYGGHAVASTGHSHPDVVRAIAAQAAQLLFYSTAVPLPQREALAQKLAELCPAPLGRVFFCNSGAEANENALHLARRYTERQTIVSVRGGWHGRTAATLACTDGPRYEQAARRAGVPLSRKVPFDDVAAVRPCQPPRTETIVCRSVKRRARWSAFSLASAPELQKNTRPSGSGQSWASFSASASRCGRGTAVE